jgi:hypothetical protein
MNLPQYLLIDPHGAAEPIPSLHHPMADSVDASEILHLLVIAAINPEWLRFLVAFQALTEFALVTASLSWVILLYPALARMRTLARRIRTLLNAAEKTHVDLISGNVEYLLADLALDVIRVRVDFIHFPILYYFRSDDRTSSLALALSELLRFAKAGSNPSAPERVRLAASTLQEALEDTAELLREHFVRSGSASPDRVFRAYAQDHLTELERED